MPSTGTITPTSSILPTTIHAGNAPPNIPRTTAAPINQDLDD